MTTTFQKIRSKIDPPPIDICMRFGVELARFAAALDRVELPDDTRVTSWFRTPAQNRKVGGAFDSQHLAGLAVDFVVPDEELLRVISGFRVVGLTAVSEVDHLHVQAHPAGFLLATAPELVRRPRG